VKDISISNLIDEAVVESHQNKFEQNKEKFTIPINRLGRDNPILWYKEVLYYEDDLDDCGLSFAQTKVRAMADCIFSVTRS